MSSGRDDDGPRIKRSRSFLFEFWLGSHRVAFFLMWSVDLTPRYFFFFFFSLKEEII